MKFERARTTEQIEERKKEILKACAKLYDEGGVDSVHFKAIGAITSFTRSTIYNYYNTKEEILLDLLLEDLKLWSSEISTMMESYETLSKEEYCRKLTDAYTKNDRMLRLISILYSTLEKNSSLEKLAEFKKEFMGLMAPFINSVYKYFHNSDDEAKQTFLSASACFVVGLYPATHLSEKQQKAIKLSGHQGSHLDFSDMCYKGLMLLSSDL